MINNVEKDYIQMGTLYDYYGGLLGERQARVFSMYYEENLSLSEIALELGISRQGVHISLRQSQKKLEKCEGVLGLIKKQGNLAKKLDEIEYAARQGDIRKIKRLVEEIREDGI
jgi:predicted DNA-binding protein YlxM (UPF0122 family)